jgi:predicted dehydrogenase
MKGLLVGYGSIGRRHLANFHGLGVDEWAVVHTGMGTLPLEPPCPVTTYTDVQSALRHEEPTFAVIANPTNLHVPSMLACLEAGCGVLVEKPISHTSEGLDSLDEEATEHGSRVLVGFQFRFHPALRRIRAALDSGVIGVPLHAQVVWGEYLPAWHPWEDWRASYAARLDLGGGVHHTICHPLDYLRMLFGDPTAVIASLSENHPLGLEVPEAADVFLRFGGGVAAQVHLDYWTRPTEHRVEIVCTDGTIRWDYIAGSFQIWHGAGESWEAEDFPGVDHRNETTETSSLWQRPAISSTL